MAASPASTGSDTPLAAPDVQASPPKPRITWKGIGIAAGLWLLYALLYTSFIARQEPDAPFAALLFGQLVYVLLLGLYSVPVWWLTVREMHDLHWGWALGTHFVLAPLYAWGGLESYLALVRGMAGADATAQMEANYQWILFGNLTIYAVQFAVYHLVTSVQRLRWREQQATELLARTREQELAALKAQINPHFLFNTLNSISATLKQDPDEAREMIARLAGMMRYALDSAERNLVPLREELDFARQYLALERHRFSDRLDAQVVVAVDEEALDRPVPPMVLQPLVENALRHGIAPSEEGGSVRVTVTSENDRLTVRVTDTGVGPPTEDPLSSDGEGVGLANTSARLERTYGPDAALQTALNDPSGFSVWFTLPPDGQPDT